MSKPFSQACENNKEPILAVLRQVFTGPGTIVEFGSGTGQHAAWFAPRLPHLTWQPTDRAENIDGVNQWVADADAPAPRPAIALDVDDDPWPITRADGAFSANTAHIMSWPQVERLFAGVAGLLRAGGRFCLYGPFNYDGDYTSASNADFDACLRTRDPASGLRDVADLVRLGAGVGLDLIEDHEMPANNRVLVWSATSG